ncbi:MAG: hypothetical protein ACLGXA_23810 [Acidobacteriota bacterium]
MKHLCASLLLMFASASSISRGQEVALIDAPEPTFSSTSGSAFSSSSLTFAAPAAAAIVSPRRPLPARSQGLTFTDWTLLGSAAALRFLDYKSTVKCMSDPANFREVELPNALVHNRPALGAFEAGTVVLNYYAYRLFTGHHHRTLARLGQTINLGALAWTVGRNYYELNEFWPRENTLRKRLNPGQ